ncbi:MAG: pyridoxamine 5'-phosphate oxidase family protein [Candidatus Binatia bacterium]
MARLTQEMKDLIDRVRFCNAATASRDGLPNVSPKGSIMWLDDETIAFCDFRSIHTRENLKTNPQIAVSIVDGDHGRFFQLKGTAELLGAGEMYRKIATRALAKAKQRQGLDLPDPNNAVVIHVQETYRFPAA